MQPPASLALDSDHLWLTPLHCFVRRHCVELFTATDEDIKIPSKGKRKPLRIGQIGIRCPWCHKLGAKASSYKTPPERSSVYFPTGIKSIYSASMNLLQRHLHSCPSVPEGIMRQYETLKSDDARSATSKNYWEQSARSIGLVDTPNGIEFSTSQPPPLPEPPTDQQFVPGKRKFESGGANKPGALDLSAILKANEEWKPSDHPGLVAPEDEPHATPFLYLLLGQMRPCTFTETDRLGKRRGLPTGFPGLACKHCYGEFGSGRFFPSSIKTLADTSKTLNLLHNHMMRCRRVPVEVREQLEMLRRTHEEERAKRFGSQKNFFTRIWESLHGKGFPKNLKIHLSIQKFEEWKQTALEKQKQKAEEGQAPVGVAENLTVAEHLTGHGNLPVAGNLAEVDPVQIENLDDYAKAEVAGDDYTNVKAEYAVGEMSLGVVPFDGVGMDAALMEQDETGSPQKRLKEAVEYST